MGILVYDITNLVIEKYSYRLNDTIYYNEDDLVTDLPFVRGYYVPAGIILYLLFSIKLGPALMEKRQPMNLRKPMLVYNFIQVICNLHLLFSLLLFPLEAIEIFNIICHPTPPDTYIRIVGIVAGFFFLILKLADWIDTVFIVLRKKHAHLTVLHLFHHTIMVFALWYCILYLRGAAGVFMAAANTTVHAIMYTYYFFLAYGKTTAKMVAPFKPILTKIQIGQFFIVILQLSVMSFMGCELPEGFVTIWIVVVTAILLFFVNFYIQAYIRPKTMNPQKKSN